MILDDNFSMFVFRFFIGRHNITLFPRTWKTPVSAHCLKIIDNGLKIAGP